MMHAEGSPIAEEVTCSFARETSGEKTTTIDYISTPLHEQIQHMRQQTKTQQLFLTYCMGSATNFH